MLGDEDYIEQLVGVAKQEISLRHPLVYDDFNQFVISMPRVD